MRTLFTLATLTLAAASAAAQPEFPPPPTPVPPAVAPPSGYGFRQPGDEAPPTIEVAPVPRLIAPPVPVDTRPVRVEEVPGGYRVTLSREAADRLLAGLNQTDEKGIATLLQDEAKRRKEPPADGGPADPDKVAEDQKLATTLDLIAVVVSTQVPAFREALRTKTGPNGAVVTVTGFQQEKVFRKPRPRLERIGKAVRQFLPEEERMTFDGLRAMARTTPLFWTVEPRQ